MYRAIDSNGLTLDFELRKHRDYVAAFHFLKRLLTTNGRPERLVTDQYQATIKAVKHLIKQDYLSQSAHGSGAKFTQGECILYHELKLEVFR